LKIAVTKDEGQPALHPFSFVAKFTKNCYLLEVRGTMNAEV
jgi:hypothetical protein